MRLENSFPMIPISQKRRIALISAIGWDSRILSEGHYLTGQNKNSGRVYLFCENGPLPKLLFCLTFKVDYSRGTFLAFKRVIGSQPDIFILFLKEKDNKRLVKTFNCQTHVFPW